MLKMIGMIMLVISGGLCGCSAASRLSKKARFLEGYMQFIRMVETEIRYSGRYISEIVSEGCGDGPFCDFLRNCRENISNGVPFPIAWEKAFNSICGQMRIPEDTARLIINFGSGLGVSDSEGQISHCKYHYGIIEPYLVRANEDKQVKGKLYSILGTCLGAAAAVILL